MATKVSAKAGEYQHLPLPPVEELYSSTNLEAAEEKYYVTTAINYTNGPPHIGHAYEALLADVIARYNRAYGRKVFFMTGTDEHGQKIARSAEGRGITPKESCDFWVEKFQSLNKRLSISNNRYIRTTDEYHEDSSRELWKRCTESGDIYLSKYTGWYNEREEMFVTDSDAKAADYKDAHGTPFKEVSEECYFFKLSSFRERIIEHLKANPDFIQPESRKQEVEAMLDEIPDLCVSRTTFDWGIKLPADCAPGHVMYVWFDALTNYLSGTKLLLPEAEGTDEERALWPADVHVIGKDITRFHCIYWPAMLMSAKLPLPKVVAGHGFVMDAEGRKMSKSVGNVVDPNEVLDLYPADTLRFYICNEASYGTDLKFSVDNLIAVHNNDLADTYGNLAQRSTLLLGKEKGHEWEVPEFTDEMERPFNLDELRTEVDRLMKGYKTKEALQEIMGAARKTNNWLGTVAPWKMKGAENDSKRRSVLRLSLEAVYILSHFLSPFLPYITTLVFRKIGQGGAIKDLNSNFLNLKAGTKVSEGPWDVAGDVEMKVLFPVLTKAVGEGEEEEKKEEKPKPKPKKEKKEEKASPKGKKKDDKPKADELPEFVEGWRVAVKQDLAQCFYLSGVEEKKYPEVSGIMTLTAEGCFDQSIYGAVGEEGKFITHTEKGALPVLTSRVGGYKYNQKEAKFTLKPHHSTNPADLSKDTPPTFTAHIDKTGVLRLSGAETSFWTRKRQV